LLVTLLVGCASPSPSPAPTEPDAATPTPSPAPTEPDTATLTPSPMPECASLLAAVQAQDIALTRSCLQQGEDANQTDSGGLSVLNYAAALGNVEIVTALLEAGSEVNFQDPWGMASLHAALKEGHDAVTLLLLEHGADVNLQTTSGYYVGFTPLHTAIYFGKAGLATIEQLLQKGADVNATNQARQTPLQMASEKGLTEVEALLIEYGAK